MRAGITAAHVHPPMTNVFHKTVLLSSAFALAKNTFLIFSFLIARGSIGEESQAGCKTIEPPKAAKTTNEMKTVSSK